MANFNCNKMDDKAMHRSGATCSVFHVVRFVW